jgi:tetratricopeptide (TPR) repeat protein
MKASSPVMNFFVINDKNLIMSRLMVKSVFYTQSFGYLMTGHGNFRLSLVGNRVVQKIEDENSKYAYIYRSRGDYHLSHGNVAEAKSQYQKSIEIDKGNPEAHISLGYIYLNDNLLQYAYREFMEAYKNIGRLYDNDDRYQLLKGMTETRYREVYNSTIPNKLKSQYICDGIKYGNEALQLYPSSKEINYFLGVFYYRNSDPSDSKARDHMLKVIEEDPGNIEPYIVLSELYYNHRNMDKASYYVDEALKIDPGNERARFIKQLTKK